MKNVRIIVDMQGFNDEKNKFIPKELAAYDGDKISHYVFKKPFALNLLPPDQYKQARWLMCNHHCIDWNSGFTPLHYFDSILKKLTKDYLFVYVKGNEKAEYIRKYSSRPIIELDDEPRIKPLTPKCMFHSKSPSVCALSNVFFLYDNFFMNE